MINYMLNENRDFFFGFYLQSSQSMYVYKYSETNDRNSKAVVCVTGQEWSNEEINFIYHNLFQAEA